MRSFFVQKAVEKKQPTLIYTCGSRGKSMFLHSAASVLEELGNNVYRDDDAKNMLTAAAGGRSSVFTAFLVYAGLLKYPRTHLVGFHKDSKVQRQVLDAYDKKILVVPYISPTDMEEAGSVEKYLQKQCYLNKKRIKQTTIIFNQDIPGIADALEGLGAKDTHGFSINDSSAELQATVIDFSYLDDAAIANDYRAQGVRFKARNGGSTLPVQVKQGIGAPHVYARLAVLELLLALGINLVESLPVIRGVEALPGRLRLLPGIKRSLLLDDTYDMHFDSALVTINEAARIPLQEGQKRILVLGDMMHEGDFTEEGHCRLGKRIAEHNYDAVVGIGERVSDTLTCAVDAGFDENLAFHFTDQGEAGKFIQHELNQGDLVVVKGAKEQELESVVKELMAFPLEAKEKLVKR